MKKQNIVVFFLVALFSVGCDNKKARSTVETRAIYSIKLDSLRQSTIDSSSYINISLLGSYPTLHECDAGSRFVNLYFCKNNDSNDTLLIFDNCGIVPEYLKHGSEYLDRLSISNHDIKRSFPEIIYINKPENITIHR